MPASKTNQQKNPAISTAIRTAAGLMTPKQIIEVFDELSERGEIKPGTEKWQETRQDGQINQKNIPDLSRKFYSVLSSISKSVVDNISAQIQTPEGRRRFVALYQEDLFAVHTPDSLAKAAAFGPIDRLLDVAIRYNSGPLVTAAIKQSVFGDVKNIDQWDVWLALKTNSPASLKALADYHGARNIAALPEVSAAYGPTRKVREGYEEATLRTTFSQDQIVEALKKATGYSELSLSTKAEVNQLEEVLLRAEKSGKIDKATTDAIKGMTIGDDKGRRHTGNGLLDKDGSIAVKRDGNISVGEFAAAAAILKQSGSAVLSQDAAELALKVDNVLRNKPVQKR